jgi:hypothetical protein
MPLSLDGDVVPEPCSLLAIRVEKRQYHKRRAWWYARV